MWGNLGRVRKYCRDFVSHCDWNWATVWGVCRLETPFSQVKSANQSLNVLWTSKSPWIDHETNKIFDPGRHQVVLTWQFVKEVEMSKDNLDDIKCFSCHRQVGWKQFMLPLEVINSSWSFIHSSVYFRWMCYCVRCVYQGKTDVSGICWSIEQEAEINLTPIHAVCS